MKMDLIPMTTDKMTFDMGTRLNRHLCYREWKLN